MAVSMPTAFPGIGPVTGFSIGDPFATPEERYGGPADPAHAVPGEQARPYSWQSRITNYPGHMGPYGPDNALLGDESALSGESAGQLGHDPYGDLVPYRGHAAPITRTLSGPLPSQYDAINGQLEQAAEIRATDLGTSRKFTLTEHGDAQQDQWHEIWNVEPGTEKYLPGSPHGSGTSLFGFANNDRTVNPLRKVNMFGFGSGHHHRRIAAGSIPGNYMWMRPGGRPLFKSLAGPARPAIGTHSPFTGDDLGTTFGIQGAVLVEVPQEYQPPPSPQVVAPVNMDEPAPEIQWW